MLSPEAPAPARPEADPTALRVVELGSEDVPLFREIMQRSFAEYRTPDFSYGTERETDESIRQELAEGGSIVAVKRGDQILAVAKHHPEPGTGMLYFWRVAVLPEHRGVGAATALVQWMYERAAREGLRGIACNVVPRHATLATLYERSDMRVVGEIDREVGEVRTIRLLRLEGLVRRSHPALVELAPAQSPILRTVLHRAYAQYQTQGIPSDALLETDETLAAKLGNGARALVVRVGGEEVAAMKFRPLDGQDLVIARLGVVPDHRGQGWAKALVDWLRAEARRQRAAGIAAVVPASDRSVQEMLEHLGFERTDSGKQLTLSGELLDVAYLRCDV